jgi:isopentenyldiphosphate isomerase
MTKPPIIIVNENDEIIGYKARDKLKSEDIYRVSAIWITNSRGDLLLARRAFTKKNDPGKWGPAAAGTVEKGETYHANMIKEVEEEIGLKNIHLKKVDKKRRRGEHNYFVQWYVALVDQSIDAFTIQKEEVAEIRWFTRKELMDQMRSHPKEFLPAVHERLTGKRKK